MTKESKQEKVTMITPVPYAHLQTKDGAESGDLVVVSLEQLIEAQKRFNSLLTAQKEKMVEELEKLMPEDSDENYTAWKLAPDPALKQQTRMTLAIAIEKLELL